MQVTPPSVAARASRILDSLGLATEPLDVQLEEILSYVEGDKKRRAGRTRWVLVGSDAITIRDDVPASVVEAAAAHAIAGRR